MLEILPFDPRNLTNIPPCVGNIADKKVPIADTLQTQYYVASQRGKISQFQDVHLERR